MEPTIAMSRMEQGDRGVIVVSAPGNGLGRRLRELGFLEGTEVCCLHVSPMGDPKAYGLRQTVFALRRKDAERLRVRVYGRGQTGET